MVERARRRRARRWRKLRDSDYVSVVAYDDVVEVVVPARHASDAPRSRPASPGLEPRGGTALFAGVVKCAARGAQVREQEPRQPHHPAVRRHGERGPELAGASSARWAPAWRREGISVATVGLGVDYNEDLMTELALRSDGSHAFVQHAADLARFLDEELGVVAEVVARDVEVKVRGAAGAHPLRVLGRPRRRRRADGDRRRCGKINGGRQHVFVVELDVDPMQAGSKRAVADVEVAFRDLLGNRDVAAQQRVEAQFTTGGARGRSEDRPAHHVRAQHPERRRHDRTGDQAARQGRLRRRTADPAEAERRGAGRDRGASTRTGASSSRANKAKQRANEMSPKPPEWNIQRKAAKKDIADDPLHGPVTAGEHTTTCASASASCSCSWSPRRWRRWRCWACGRRATNARAATATCARR